MSKKIAILQSNYIPWKGYFDIINMVDEFVLYDDMRPGYEGRLNGNIYQIASLIPICLSLIVYGIVEAYWPNKKYKIRRYIIIFSVLVLSLHSILYCL